MPDIQTTITVRVGDSQWEFTRDEAAYVAVELGRVIGLIEDDDGGEGGDGVNGVEINLGD